MVDCRSVSSVDDVGVPQDSVGEAGSVIGIGVRKGIIVGDVDCRRRGRHSGRGVDRVNGDSGGDSGHVD